MSQPTPESPDEPTPQKRRSPQISRLKKDNSELDLWDFDDVEQPDVQPPAEIANSKDLPLQPKTRSKAPKEIERAPRPLPPTQLDDATVVRQSSQISRKTSMPEQARRTRPADDIGELEDSNWADADAPAKANSIPEDKPVVQVEPELEDPITAHLEIPDPIEETFEAANEFSPASEVPIDTRPIRERLGFSKIEKIGLCVLAVALISTAVFFLSTTLGRVPTKSDREERPSFPINGSHVRIKDAGSYWREPVLTGPGAEAVRRNTLLIPVLTLDLEGGPCAIRAFFRDDKGEFVGDGVTRAAGNGKIEIAATAGLEDLGSHAAYRTGETKPWKIEIFEAPGVDSSRQDFKKLLELTISTDRR